MRFYGKAESATNWRKETVAELGGAVLLQCLRQTTDADVGGCWEYVCSWCSHDGIEPTVACQKMLKRTCDAVSLVLDAAERLTEPGTGDRSQGAGFVLTPDA